MCNYNNNKRKKVKNKKPTFVCTFQYLGVTFANILINVKMVEKHKMSKDQQKFYKCKMCNNTIKITFSQHNYKKSHNFNAVDGQGLANNYDRPIKEQTTFRITFGHAQIKMRDNEFCDVTPASVDGQKFITHNFILSASSIFFKKLLVNNKYCHPLILMRGMENESYLLHPFTLKKENLKETRWSPL